MPPPSHPPPPKPARRHNSTVSETLRPRGAGFNPPPRFEPTHTTPIPQDQQDDWDPNSTAPHPQRPTPTTITREIAKTIISRNQSPDIPFVQSINPYRGCEHGCIYCYARPAHAYVGLSPGLDFETRLFAKTNAHTLLEQEINKPAYTPQTIALGANTDPYQPIEKNLNITRNILATLLRYKHPVAIVTKSSLILRDLDLLALLAEHNLVRVALSITTLDPRLARAMEPRATTPNKRLQTLATLNAHNIPTMLMNAPIIPALNEAEIDNILKAGQQTGTRHAGYVLLRLPRETAPLFREWLQAYMPDRSKRILSIIKTMRGGKLYDSDWQQRMRGQGPHAGLIRQRFQKALKRYGYQASIPPLATDLMKKQGEQLALDLF